MQLWMEINVVTLHKVVETMPQQMRSVIKSKGGPIKYYSVQLLFWPGSVDSISAGRCNDTFLQQQLNVKSYPPNFISCCILFCNSQQPETM